MDKADAYAERMMREHEREKTLLDEALAGCRKALEPLMQFFSAKPPRPSVHLTALLAQLLRDISGHPDGSKVPDYDEVRGLMEHYIGGYVEENLPDIRWLADWCKENGYGADNPYHAWGDNYIFYEPCDHSRVLVIVTHHKNYLFVCPEKSPLTLHSLFLRRIWETRDPEEADDGGMHDYWSDNTPGNEYVYRPDLQWFRDDDFKMENDPFGREEEILDFEDHEGKNRHWLFGPCAEPMYGNNGEEAMNALSYVQLILTHIKEETDG